MAAQKEGGKKKAMEEAEIKRQEMMAEAVTAVEKSASQVGEEVSKGRDISRPKTCAECEDRARTSAGVRLSSLRAASAQLVEAVLPWPLACPPARPMAMPWRPGSKP